MNPDLDKNKVIFLRYNGCCTSHFNRMFSRLLEHFFDEEEVLDYDSRQGWAMFCIDTDKKTDPTESSKYLDSECWEVSTEEKIKALKTTHSWPVLCELCIENKKRLHNGQLPLSKPRKS